MKKFNNELGNLSRQNKAINDYHLRWKLLKSNFQKLFLMLGKIFYYFLVTLNNFVFELRMHHRVKMCTGGRTDRQTECINSFQIF